MDILCSTDNNYIMPTGIMLTSLLVNNSGTDITIHVMIDNTVTEDSKKSLSSVTHSYGARIEFYLMDKRLFDNFPLGKDYQSSHITTMATYYRLFAHKVLPPHLNKVIYLDGDIIVRHSLNDLWNIGMTNCPIAGVPDIQCYSVLHYNRLHYSMQLGYFNAGVLLINLEYWRNNSVLDDFIRVIDEKRSVLSCHDQDVLNYCFRENKMLLPIKYNMQTGFLYRRELVPLPWSLDYQIDEGQRDPAIIHFITFPKPWNSDCNHPYKPEFICYRNKTEWRNSKEHRHYHGRSRLYWAIVKTAIKLGISKQSNDPDTYFSENLNVLS